MATAEQARLRDNQARKENWQRWGPYLPERQWATVREDYSADGDAWGYFPHEHARSRVYRWGEDGLLGWCDRQCRVAFAPALWNGHDPFLKERLFGVTGPQGNHGEDVKECYYYLDATPTHSYNRALYKYPQREFPYRRLVEENGRRSRLDPEYELADTGIFEDDRYFDVFVEYAKAGPEDVLIEIRACNRSAGAAPLWILPTLWCRNVWSWGRTGEDYGPRPRMFLRDGAVVLEHATLGEWVLTVEGAPDRFLFTDNETNRQRLWGVPNEHHYVKDAFHSFLVDGRADAVNPAQVGTKAAALYYFDLPAKGEVTVRLRLSWGVRRGSFESVMRQRRREADEFYAALEPQGLTAEERPVWRQAYAGLLWSKQFYHYSVAAWLDGDPTQPRPPASRHRGRNASFRQHLYNRDVILMPDRWEYPWYAAWDLAFHVIPMARLDPHFAQAQLLLMLREWYLHPNGQIPAYEWNFADVNPPVHAWACLRVFRETGDRDFLERAFHKLLLNFTWWVNVTDADGNNVFTGGFLGLDNVGVFDRSKFPHHLGELEQADATAWMAFFSLKMLEMALELARQQPAYEDIASKFFEHFVAITSAVNHLGELGLWDDQDGFYYDVIRTPKGPVPLRVHSMVGLLCLAAVTVLDGELLERLPAFSRRLKWFLTHNPELVGHLEICPTRGHILCAIALRERLLRVLGRMLSEEEFLSPYGLRSLSRYHAEHPFVYGGSRVDYEPAESITGMFGGNSNWRGPVWFPVNYLLIDALKQYHRFYGADVACGFPTGGPAQTLDKVALNLEQRLCALFLPGPGGRPAHAGDPRYASDPHWRDLILFHEYFHGDTGAGLGANHQTGWTALVATFLEEMNRDCAILDGRLRPGGHF